MSSHGGSVRPRRRTARLALLAQPGTIHCGIRFKGGVEVISPQTIPLVGNRSTGIKINAVDLADNSLTVEADVNDAGSSSFEVETPWKSDSVDGGTIRQMKGNRCRVDLNRGGTAPDSFGYSHRRAIIHFVSGPAHESYIDDTRGNF